MPALYRKWGGYRREQLLELLISRLSALELSAEDERVLVAQVKASQTAAKMSKADKQTAPTASSAELDSPARSSGTGTETQADRARQLARRAVELMAYDDLRALRIPLGAIIDAT